MNKQKNEDKMKIEKNEKWAVAETEMIKDSAKEKAKKNRKASLTYPFDLFSVTKRVKLAQMYNVHRM